ncbi:MAG TPA: hypothetical protein VLJ37_09205 [bacterium]|nr:hypothetical protein [bacterium]
MAGTRIEEGSKRPTDIIKAETEERVEAIDRSGARELSPMETRDTGFTTTPTPGLALAGREAGPAPAGARLLDEPGKLLDLFWKKDAAQEPGERKETPALLTGLGVLAGLGILSSFAKSRDLASARSEESPLRKHLEAHLNGVDLGSTVDVKRFGNTDQALAFAETQLERAYRGEIEPGSEIPVVCDVPGKGPMKGKIRFLTTDEKIDGSRVGPSGPGGRIVLQVTFSEPIGTNGIAELKPGRQTVTVQRVSGGRTETVQVADGPAKPTNTLYIIGGPYGPTGKFGLYTLYAGTYAPPMTDTAFWSRHAFVTGDNRQSFRATSDGRMEVMEGSRLHQMIQDGKILPPFDGIRDRVAGAFHEDWRSQYAREPRERDPETGRPVRWKTTKDADWIARHGTDRVDIARTRYEDLPAEYQAENKASADVAVGEIYKAVGQGRVLDDAFVETASALVHERWLERNPWAPDDQKVPYDRLTEIEKDKDRAVVRRALSSLSEGFPVVSREDWRRKPRLFQGL